MSSDSRARLGVGGFSRWKPPLSRYGPLTYATALTTAEMLARRQEREGSAVFINGVGEEQVRSLSSIQRAILLISRARMLLADGELTAAHTNLQRADELVRAASDLRLKRLLPDILSVRATVEQLEAKPDRASASLSEAMAAMGPERTAHRAAALIARAGLFAHVPGRLDASDDVNEAIALLRARVKTPVGQPLRLDEAAPAFRAAAALVKANPPLQGPRGLQLVEQLREVLDGVPQGGENHDASVASTQPDRAILFYLFSDDSLLAWVTSKSGVAFTEIRTDARDVTRLVNQLTVQVNRNPSREDLWRTDASAIPARVRASRRARCGGGKRLGCDSGTGR